VIRRPVVEEKAMPQIKSQQNFWAGVLFLFVGAGQTWLALQYKVGTASQMGPGFMPAVLGCVLMVLGLVIVGASLILRGPRIEPVYWRPLVCIVGAMLLFALLIESAGLALTTVLVVLVAGCGYRERISWAGLVVLAVGMAAFAVGLFVHGLKQPIPTWWAWG
jgi:putative tricarboxylic transport membrane protein